MSYETRTSDARDIWENALLPGLKVEMIFSSLKDFEYFRMDLYRIKRKSERHLVDIGFMEGSEVQSIIFTKLEDKETNPNGPLELRFSIYLGKRKRESKIYTYTIME